MGTLSTRLALLLSVSIMIGLTAQSALGGFAKRITPTSRIVRIEGHWGVVAEEAEQSPASDSTASVAPSLPAEDAPVILGELNLATAGDGTGVRPFEVVAVRSYHDADGGMEIFRKACIRPAVNLRGRPEVLARMVAVPEGEPMTLYGQFATGSSELLVSDVELPEEPTDD